MRPLSYFASLYHHQFCLLVSATTHAFGCHACDVVYATAVPVKQALNAYVLALYMLVHVVDSGLEAITYFISLVTVGAETSTNTAEKNYINFVSQALGIVTFQKSRKPTTSSGTFEEPRAKRDPL